MTLRPKTTKGSPQQLSRERGGYGERRLAKKVGGVVVGKSKAVKLADGVSWNGEKFVQVDVKCPPDVIAPPFCYESKWLKTTPKCLDKVMTQAVRNCPTSSGLIPVGVIANRENGNVFYVVTEHDWLDLHVGNKGGIDGQAG